VSLRISVIGTGYLGATHAACMAELGHEVIGVDIDQLKIDRLTRGELPFYEPDLQALLLKHVQTGRLRFTTSYEEIGSWADVHFVGVGTPQKSNGIGADLSYVEAAVTSLAQNITKNSLIVGKSTVPVGTARRLRSLVLEKKNPNVDILLAWNPEFLREGFAVTDTLDPDRIVVGVDEPAAEMTLRQLYANSLAREVPFISTDFETAELVKVAANAFLATKISFINAFSEITELVGGDIRALADAMGRDARIGRRFLNAGVGFGGGCLPKDIRSLQSRVEELGLVHLVRFLTEVDNINLRRRSKVLELAEEMLGSLSEKKIGVLGITFKPDSDDVRDSPALEIAMRMSDAGAAISVYDPKGSKNASKIAPNFHFAETVTDCTTAADLVVLLTEWPEFCVLSPDDLQENVSAKNIIDARNVLNIRAWQESGWEIATLGNKFRSNTRKINQLEDPMSSVAN